MSMRDQVTKYCLYAIKGKRQIILHIGEWLPATNERVILINNFFTAAERATVKHCRALDVFCYPGKNYYSLRPDSAGVQWNYGSKYNPRHERLCLIWRDDKTGDFVGYDNK